MSDRRERQRNRDTQRDFIFRTRQEGRQVQRHIRVTESETCLEKKKLSRCHAERRDRDRETRAQALKSWCQATGKETKTVNAQTKRGGSYL